ncbi:hypothetical protein A3Q56_06955, partial [Intoshia linei]
MIVITIRTQPIAEAPNKKIPSALDAYADCPLPKLRKKDPFNEEDDTFDSNSEDESDYKYFSDHLSESDECLSDIDDGIFIGKDGITKWKIYESKLESTNGQFTKFNPSQNTIFDRNNISILNFFKLLFTNDIVDIIIESTNIKIISMQHKYSRTRDAQCIDNNEFHTFLGMKYEIILCQNQTKSRYQF